jgi:hypothetical protein
MTDDDWADYMKKREEEKKARQEQLGAEIYPRLQAVGVSTIEAYYSGGGDDGCVEDIELKGTDGNKIELDAQIFSEKLRELIDEFICSFLPRGWEINEGSSGNVVLNLTTRTLSFDHNYYVERNESWEEKWHIPTITP